MSECHPRGTIKVGPARTQKRRAIPLAAVCTQRPLSSIRISSVFCLRLAPVGWVQSSRRSAAASS